MRRRMRPLFVCATALLAAALMAGCAVSPDKPESDSLALLQHQRTEASAAQAEGRRMWFAGFAMNTRSPAFLGDLDLVKNRLASLGHPLFSYEFSNAWQGRELHRPYATLHTLSQAMERIGRQARPDDIVMLLVSTHGGFGLLSVNANGVDYPPITADQLADALRPLQDTPTVIVLSACHSGSFIPKLQRDNRIILTAASAARSSFGCAFEDRNTWFVEALFGPHFDASESLSQLMTQAQATITEREVLMKYPASEPQIWIGPKARWLAERPLRDWWQL